MEHQRDCLLVPCGHWCLCKECAEKHFGFSLGPEDGGLFGVLRNPDSCESSGGGSGGGGSSSGRNTMAPVYCPVCRMEAKSVVKVWDIF